ncbi:MAG: N-acetyltransferase [Anaerolineales bacterium]|nr:N-acetyltransferase [Anaerolineales bacterium]
MRNENLEVIHNQKERRFEVTTDGHVAVLDYMLRGQIIIFTHTGVPPGIGGRGLGSKLVKTGLDYARENGLRVRSLCWFVSKYIRRHSEYQELLKE